MTLSNTELGAIIERDKNTAETWFNGPASGPAQAYRDRRALITALQEVSDELEETQELE